MKNEMANEMYIKLDSLEKVNKYINIANKLPVDLDILYGRYIVDGKSVMGIFGLDLSKNLLVKIRTHDAEMCDYVRQELKDFIVGGD